MLNLKIKFSYVFLTKLYIYRQFFFFQFRHSNSFQFGKVDINFHLGQNDKSWSNKHCGNINAMELDFNSLNHANQMKMLPYAFKDPKGKIEVRIYVANETIPSGTELDLKIAFTAYQRTYIS